MKAILWSVAWAAKLALYGAALTGAVMSVIVFVAVALRYIFRSPVPFVDELVGLCFSTVVFLAIPYLFAIDRNIRVSLIADKLAGGWQRALRLFCNLGIILFFMVVGSLSFDFAAFSFAINARSDIAQLPVAPWMALLPFSCFLTAIVVLLRTAFAPFGDGFDDDARAQEGRAAG